MLGQYDHLAAWVLLADAPEDFQTTQARHGQVKKYDIGAQGCRASQRLQTIAGRPDHDDVWIQRQERGQTVPQDRVIIRK
jgi:hypothetical protein